MSESDYPFGDGTRWTDEEREKHTRQRKKRIKHELRSNESFRERRVRKAHKKLKRRVKALEDRIRDMQPINVPEFRATFPIRSHIRSAFHELFPSTFLPDQPKPEPQTSGEAKPMYLVDPYTLVSSRDGVYLLRPGEEIRIPFTGRMRLLWERQYLEQEKHREHVARNRARAPRRPEYGWLEGPVIPSELFWLNPEHYYLGYIDPRE